MGKFRIKNNDFDEKPYIIAEIGCNHCGSIETATKMTIEAAACGVDAVKYQKRTPGELFSDPLLNSDYSGPHSYGKTYGEHRAALDWFGVNEFLSLKKTCDCVNVDFIITPFTLSDFDFVLGIGVDAIKIASCDVRNTVMLKEASKQSSPVIMSTGGASMQDVHRAVEALGDNQPAILHCVSSYPVTDNMLNLYNLKDIQHHFPGFVYGFSSHHPGLLPNYIAYMFGARIFEVHFTLNRGQKGTDHGFSLEPEGLRKLCDDIRRIPTMIGNYDKRSDYSGFVTKFGKSWYPNRVIEKGELIRLDDIRLMAPADGLQPYEVDKLIGRRVKKTLLTSDSIKEDDLEG